MGNIPDSSNFFSMLTTKKSREEIAHLYGASGWHIRECSREDFEVCCEWAELIIDGESPLLLHGPVAEVMKNLPAILQPLDEAGVKYQGECYGENKELLQDFSSAGSVDG